MCKIIFVASRYQRSIEINTIKYPMLQALTRFFSEIDCVVHKDLSLYNHLFSGS